MFNPNPKVILSLASIGVAGALIVGATFAFFSDTETSTGNLLQAGKLDLKIDSQAHYDGLICQGTEGSTTWAQDPQASPTARPELVNTPCDGTWTLKDLTASDKFYNISDLKPGDGGENTISLHVFDNDAWGQIRVHNIIDSDVDCTGPEIASGADIQCASPTPVPGAGELAQNMTFHLWLDQGSTPGFQCYDPATPSVRRVGCDPTEGDNIQQVETEPDTTAAGVVVPGANYILLNLAPALAQSYTAAGCSVVDGHTNYTSCHGLAADGRLVGSATYYVGVKWDLDPEAGNEVQSDSITADVSFDVTQHRNQTNPFPSPGI